jgi:hypothetical protein
MSSQADQNSDFSGVTHDLLALFQPAKPLERSSLVMLLAAMTSFACAALITLPGVIFDQSAHHICSLFTQALQTDHASFVPICFSGLTSAFALALPVKTAPGAGESE